MPAIFRKEGGCVPKIFQCPDILDVVSHNCNDQSADPDPIEILL